MDNERVAEEPIEEELELTITSDGTPHGTVIKDAQTGRTLMRVDELKLHIKKGEVYGTAEIILRKPKMNLSGRFKVVEEFGS